MIFDPVRSRGKDGRGIFTSSDDLSNSIYGPLGYGSNGPCGVDGVGKGGVGIFGVGRDTGGGTVTGEETLIGDATMTGAGIGDCGLG